MNLEELVNLYDSATATFVAAVAEINDDNVDRHQTGEWSARQIIHHMADSEAQSYARLRRLLAEPNGSLILGYDEAAWAECQVLGYQELPIEHSLDVVRSVRQASLDIVRRLQPDDFLHFAEHTESGRYTLETWFDTYCHHPVQHAAQLQAAVNVKA